MKQIVLCGKIDEICQTIKALCETAKANNIKTLNEYFSSISKKEGEVYGK